MSRSTGHTPEPSPDQPPEPSPAQPTRQGREGGRGAPSTLSAWEAERIAMEVRTAVSSALGAPVHGPLDIRVRISADHVEVQVSNESVPRATPATGGWSFAGWFAGQLSGHSLSQEGAARALGVSVKTVNRWIRGETEPRFRELLLIYGALGASPLPPDQLGVLAKEAESPMAVRLG